MATDRGYMPFEQQHRDIVTAVDFNFYGTRMVTASADHRIKVYDRKPEEDSWNIVDTFGAHDAEITDVKWNGPFMGDIFGSVAEDGIFKLWQEDVTEIPNSGRRFTRIFQTSSETRVPFMSLDVKNIDNETYIALVTRDGYLKVLEPVDHEDLTHWHVMHQRYLCPTPDRQNETSFKVAFHREKVPCWAAVRAGLDRRALSLAVACMNSVKVLRTDKEREWYNVAEFKEARDLVRGVSWANGSMRGWDVIATGSKDGCIRIYELRANAGDANENFVSAEVEASKTDRSDRAATANSTRRTPNAPSGIGAGLAGSSNDRNRGQKTESAPGRIKETVTMVEEINLHTGAIWKVSFSQGGDVLGSIGDDGVLRTWKRALDGRWYEYAAIDVAGEKDGQE